MRQRQSLGRLHHAEHELATHPPVLGQAELAQVAGQLGLALHADGGHVVEHHRQILVDQRAQQPGQRRLDAVLVFDQRIHRPQQVLMRHLLGRKARQRHRLQPAQHAELGRRVAQAVEHHHPQQPLGVERAMGIAQYAAERLVPAQLVPQRVQHPGVAHRQRRGKAHRRRLRLLAVDDAVQAANQGIGPAGAYLLQAAKGGDDALAGNPLVVAVGLHELDVAARSGAGELDEHVATIPPESTLSHMFKEMTCHYIARSENTPNVLS
ncbi:hypothetical protein GALL_482830 [mine drainage metagenome]|uniref:Uncharacterized protein n=1 Tax=mine drainage metagenome TaxID=410659 RepID=A0A1J5PFF8_9ZZZZ